MLVVIPTTPIYTVTNSSKFELKHRSRCAVLNSAETCELVPRTSFTSSRVRILLHQANLLDSQEQRKQLNRIIFVDRPSYPTVCPSPLLQRQAYFAARRIHLPITRHSRP